MYERFQGDGRPNSGAGEGRPPPGGAEFANPYWLCVTVFSEIEKTNTSVQEGIKSIQYVFYDGRMHKDNKGKLRHFASEGRPGSTEFLAWDLPGIRNRFELVADEVRGRFLSFSVLGETASAVGWLPNINYDLSFAIDIEKRTYGISGSHDGYPSYYAIVTDSTGLNKRIYHHAQGFLNELTGESDVPVKEAGTY